MSILETVNLFVVGVPVIVVASELVLTVMSVAVVLWRSYLAYKVFVPEELM